MLTCVDVCVLISSPAGAPSISVFQIIRSSTGSRASRGRGPEAWLPGTSREVASQPLATLVFTWRHAPRGKRVARKAEASRSPPSQKVTSTLKLDHGLELPWRVRFKARLS
ncbi:hypothetical protein E2C01_008247 [Portunus trituberculatus]|uniref:Uncharacterized protein n=1 Tax=Portunus trituberculatus TaxID=210409 RepID=A0A5B7D2A5_PORTR|nr:hypothetical protein [Portunus trituberculatus]